MASHRRRTTTCGYWLYVFLNVYTVACVAGGPRRFQWDVWLGAILDFGKVGTEKDWKSDEGRGAGGDFGRDRKTERPFHCKIVPVPLLFTVTVGRPSAMQARMCTIPVPHMVDFDKDYTTLMCTSRVQSVTKFLTINPQPHPKNSPSKWCHTPLTCKLYSTPSFAFKHLKSHTFLMTVACPR